MLFYWSVAMANYMLALIVSTHHVYLLCPVPPTLQGR